MPRPLMLAAALTSLLSVAVTGSPAMARNDRTWPADQLGKETSIPFVRMNNLYNFDADSDRGVYLQDQSRRWYYARVLGPCTGLPFAQRIGVDTRFGGGQFDRTGNLLIDGQRCSIDSLTTSNGPPPKPGKSDKPNAGKANGG